MGRLGDAEGGAAIHEGRESEAARPKRASEARIANTDWQTLSRGLPNYSISHWGYSCQKTEWRRGRDSNPRSPARGTTVFETAPFDRSGTSPRSSNSR